MERDLQITVRGLDDAVGQSLAEALASFLIAFAEADRPLDFRRMHRVIAAADFSGELAEQSRNTASGRPINYTNEEYAVAVAKVLLLPRPGDFEILPILNAQALLPLLEDPDSEQFKFVLHLLHHEFCHVHDDNKKLDAIPGVWLSHRYVGKDMFLRPLAEACWSEYVANRLSASSATEAWIVSMADSLADAVIRTKPAVDCEILSYRMHGELERLLAFFGRHGEFLVKTAAYVFGYLDGLPKPLEQISVKAAQHLAGSYFEATSKLVHEALREMYATYPAGWKDLRVYDRLAQSIDFYYDCMGLVLSTVGDGQAYVRVPFRPETTPSQF